MENEIFEQFMNLALDEAFKARKIDEVPVGAIVVKNGKVIAKAHNKKNKQKNALHHAEILALNKAQKKLKDWHLYDCTLFVTLEPCPMCGGAIINARVGKVVFGAYDKKAGCFGSVFDFSKAFNHTPQIFGGIKEKECGEILSNYFKQKRETKNGNKRSRN